MLSFGFTLWLINGLRLVAYLKVICRSAKPHNIIPQNIRAVFNYKVRAALTRIMENTKYSREKFDANLSVI